jgi:hypothetical protein
MNTLIPSCCISKEGDMVTVFPFSRDQETKNAVNALLMLSARDRDVHMADNEDDETIDAESLSEQHEENRTHTAPQSESSVYAGDEDFEIGTIQTDDPGEPVGELV